MSRHGQRLQLFYFCVCWTGLNAVSAQQPHITARNVPYHRQFTDYACGDASVEMMLHHYGSDVDQVCALRVCVCVCLCVCVVCVCVFVCE